jgi:hypothetical protein
MKLSGRTQKSCINNMSENESIYSKSNLRIFTFSNVLNNHRKYSPLGKIYSSDGGH